MNPKFSYLGSKIFHVRGQKEKHISSFTKKLIPQSCFLLSLDGRIQMQIQSYFVFHFLLIFNFNFNLNQIKLEVLFPMKWEPQLPTCAFAFYTESKNTVIWEPEGH